VVRSSICVYRHNRTWLLFIIRVQTLYDAGARTSLLGGGAQGAIYLRISSEEAYDVIRLEKITHKELYRFYFPRNTVGLMLGCVNTN
jgi:hypothetical protein